MLAAWFYTGGRRPYGYRGLGEVFVFVFFGLVAVGGTAYVQVGRVAVADAAAGVGDRRAGLRDPGGQQPARHRRRRRASASAPWPPGSAMRGPGALRRSLVLIAALMIVVVAALTSPWALLGLVGLLLLVPAVRTVLSGGRGPALIGC